VNELVELLYTRIKAEKPQVKFGISPFGIWRPGFPKQVVGLDAYEDLYADSRLWLSKGWVDYFSPQLYWPIKAPKQSFPVLLDWWSGENTRQRHLWPGLASSRISKDLPADEIASEIELTRKQSNGHIHWNVSSLMRNQGGITDLLHRNVYAAPALVPASPWLDSTVPGKPNLTVRNADAGQGWKLQWNPTGNKPVWLWLAQLRRGTNWVTQIIPGEQGGLMGARGDSVPDSIAVTAIDRVGNAGPTAIYSPAPSTNSPAGKAVAVTLPPPQK
jgi:hypothetical protein